MTFRTVIDALTEQSDALRVAVEAKKETLDAAEAVAVASAAVVVGKQPGAEANAATASAKATEASGNATQIAAYKTAAAALDVTTTATAAVANLLPDMLAKKDPARHPFRKKMPTLVLDFERQKCHRYSPSTGFGETPLLPFMTFARNSSATYTGPDGLIKTAAANEARFDYDPLTGECKGLLVEEQRTNLLTYSEHLINTYGWAFNGGCVASPPDRASPSGKMNGVLLKSTGLEFARVEKGGISVVAGAAYTLRYILRKGSASHAHFTVEKSTVSTMRAFIDLTSLATSVNLGSFSAGSITGKVIGEYIQVTIAFTPRVTGAISIFVGPSRALDTSWSNSGDTVYVYSAQLEAGSFPTSYIPTPATFTGRASTATYLDANGVVQTAASGVARSNAYDYDSDGVLRPIGLLLEASATNKLLYSEQFDNAAWYKEATGVATPPVVTANYGVAPDGTTTADRVQFALNGGTVIGDQSNIAQTQTTVAGTTYTQSVWLKTADASTKVAQISFNGENPKLVTVTGVWQRFSNTGVASDTIRNFRLALRGATGTSDSADLLVWGAQQGVGSYPTSYIPTTSAQVTRAADTSTSAQATRVADDAKVDGTKFSDFYNQTQGTLVATARIGDSTSLLDSAGVRRGLAAVRGASYNDIVRLCSAGRDFVVTSGGVDLMDVSIGTLSPNSVTRAAIRLKGSNFIGTRDGSLGSAANSGGTPNVSMLFLGKSDVVNGLLNGHVSRISYYPQPFTNEELQVATSA